MVLKQQSKDDSSTTGAQLETTMEPNNKEESVSIVSDQVDSVSIASNPVVQSLVSDQVEPVSIVSLIM